MMLNLATRLVMLSMLGLVAGCEPAEQSVIPSSPRATVAAMTPPVSPQPPVTAKDPPAVDLNRLAAKNFDDIKFDIEPDAPFFRKMLTDGIERLNGQRIRIRGWILPTARKRGLKEFVLVRDNQECCFGPGAALFDCILVQMQPGKTAEFSNYSVAVEGRFSVQQFPPDSGQHPLAIYRLEGELVER